MKNRIILIGILVAILAVVMFFYWKKQNASQAVLKEEATKETTQIESVPKKESIASLYQSSWEQLGLTLLKDNSGAYLFSAFTPISDSTLYITGSFSEGNFIKTYNLHSKTITDSILIADTPFDITSDNEFVYVLAKKKVVKINKATKTQTEISFSSRIRNIERLEVKNGSIYLLVANGNTVILKDGNEEKQSGWFQENGKFVFVNRFINGELSQNKCQFELIGTDGSKTGKTYDFNSKIGTVYHLGNSDSQILFTVEKIVQENPLKVNKQLTCIESTNGALKDINYKETLPQVQYAYLKNSIKVKGGKIYYCTIAPEGLYYFSVSIDKLTEKGYAGFTDSVKTKAYHYNDAI